MRRALMPLIATVLVAICTPELPSADWHHPLYLPGDGYWQTRIEVQATNHTDQALEGRMVSVRIGRGPGAADLAGQPVERMRACTASGVEVLFAVAGPDGQPVTMGAATDGGTLTLPVDCPARGSATYYVYFDNPGAWAVPDFLNARTTIVNGDLEQGAADVPAGWHHDEPDAQHRAEWVSERPQSGQKCLKTVVAAGAQPTWIATRQRDVQVIPGARYRVRAWVRAENVRGRAGWYLHVGSRERSMMLAPMLDAGAGTFDWRQVETEFTAPAGADQLDVGTVLRGTGTAWFDSVSLELLDGGQVVARAEQPERRVLREEGDTPAWYTPATGGVRAHRAVIRTYNFSDVDAGKHTVHVDLGDIERRMRGRLNPRSLLVTFAGKPLPAIMSGKMLGIESALPARTARTYHVYFSDDPQIGPVAGTQQAAGMDRNLLANPSFEQGKDRPEGWNASGATKGVRFSLDTQAAPGQGLRAARMDVAPDVRPSWRGWRQSTPVEGGKSYLVAGWIKCRDVAGDALFHLHFQDVRGRLCKDHGMTSIGPAIHGTTDWTLLSGIVQPPSDAARVEFHLTMQHTGTLWHDGLTLIEVRPAAIARFEGQPLTSGAPLRVWPVNAVVKVFPDDPAPSAAGAASLVLARNEQEPLQLALRSAEQLKDVRVEVVAPVGPGGAKLDDVQVNVVGYVPMDHASNYYQSDTPTWYRKFPRQASGCDGWAGLWPDPLLPRDTLTLQPNQTQAVWITVGAGTKTAPGDYRGTVRLLAGSRLVAEVPFGVHVWRFTLPEQNHLAAIYDVRCTPRELWGGTNQELYRTAAEFMHQRRLCPDKLEPAPKMEYRDGRVVADFTEFDQAGEWYFNHMHFPHSYTPWHFYLFGWGHPPTQKFGEQPYPGEPPFEGADRAQLRPEFKKAYQACLKVFWDHVTEKGWRDRFTLYISDEPYDAKPTILAQMKALCQMIHEVDPSIPIYSSTWHHVPDWDGSLTVWGLGHYGVVPPEKLEQLRTGAKVWFTTDGQMCTDTPYCAVERLLPHYAFKYHARAYEFWGATWLTYDPYRFGWHAYIHQAGEPGKYTWVRYPNGDGFLIYPGAPINYSGLVSSIRLEQAREGVEDYEYLYMLRQLTAKAKAAGRSVAEAEQVLADAARLVEIPNAGGRYSSKILPDPDAVLRLKRALGPAIERLAP
jgi:hypothetical protein